MDSREVSVSIPEEMTERLFKLLKKGLDAHEISDLLRPGVAAKKLDISRPTVYKMIASGLLPSVQWAANGERPTVRIRPTDLRDFIERHRK